MTNGNPNRTTGYAARTSHERYEVAVRSMEDGTFLLTGDFYKAEPASDGVTRLEGAGCVKRFRSFEPARLAMCALVDEYRARIEPAPAFAAAW